MNFANLIILIIVFHNWYMIVYSEFLIELYVFQNFL